MKLTNEEVMLVILSIVSVHILVVWLSGNWQKVISKEKTIVRELETTVQKGVCKKCIVHMFGDVYRVIYNSSPYIKRTIDKVSYGKCSVCCSTVNDLYNITTESECDVNQTKNS